VKTKSLGTLDSGDKLLRRSKVDLDLDL